MSSLMIVAASIFGFFRYRAEKKIHIKNGGKRPTPETATGDG